MKDLMDLISKVHAGQVSVTDLSPEEAEEVLAGYREVAEVFCNQESTRELGEAILAIIAEAGLDDPFDVAIVEAESRGSTYWELETNSIH